MATYCSVLQITWMPTTTPWALIQPYMMKDVYSRKLVANEVWEAESGEHASALLTKACLIEGTAGHPLVLHWADGSVMKGVFMHPATTHVEGRFVVQPAAGERRTTRTPRCRPHGQVLSDAARTPV